MSFMPWAIIYLSIVFSIVLLELSLNNPISTSSCFVSTPLNFTFSLPTQHGGFYLGLFLSMALAVKCALIHTCLLALQFCALLLDFTRCRLAPSLALGRILSSPFLHSVVLFSFLVHQRSHFSYLFFLRFALLKLFICSLLLVVLSPPFAPVDPDSAEFSPSFSRVLSFFL